MTGPGQFQKSETSLLTSPAVRGYRLTSARKVQAKQPARRHTVDIAAAAAIAIVIMAVGAYFAQ
jgi:hypothetical protein